MKLIKKMFRQAQFAWIDLNERYLNIETADQAQYEEVPGWWRGEKTSASRHQDNCAYGTPDYYYIYKVINILAPDPDDVVYDIGSGKGRILCAMSRRNVKKCVGIELFEEFCVVARANVAKMRGQRSPIEIRCEDASIADVSDGTIYFLFNPFGRETLTEMMSNIEASLAKNPRRIRIVYYNSVCRDVLDARSWLKCFRSLKTFNGLDILFYESTSSGVAPAERGAPAGSIAQA